MKCRACDVILTDREAVRKDQHGEFIDMCSDCLDSSFNEDIEYISLAKDNDEAQTEK